MRLEFPGVLLPQSWRQAKDHFGSYIDLSDRLFSFSPIYLSRVNPGLSADVNKKNPRGLYSSSYNMPYRFYQRENRREREGRKGQRNWGLFLSF
jgi:hypothetical protein